MQSPCIISVFFENAPWRQLQPVCERDEGVANRLGVIYIYRVCILRNITNFGDMLQKLNIFKQLETMTAY